MTIGGNGSHWEGCETAHHDCALERLREARGEVERMKDAVLGSALAVFRNGEEEIDRLREEVERLRAALIVISHMAPHNASVEDAADRALSALRGEED